MAITQAMCTSFKKELLEGQHDFRNGQDQYKLALFTSSATLGASTTGYATTNEASTAAGYPAGGQVLTNVNPTTSGTTAFTDFSDEVFDDGGSGVTVTARGALIYNTQAGGGSNTTNAVVVLDFGADKTATSGAFTVQFPTADASSAIIRIA